MKTEPLTWHFYQPFPPLTYMICKSDNEATFKIYIKYKGIDLQLLACNSCRQLPEVEIVDRMIIK